VGTLLRRLYGPQFAAAEPETAARIVELVTSFGFSEVAVKP
jgi:hypothetical protein